MTTQQNGKNLSFYKTSDLALAAIIFLFRPLEAIDKTSNPHKSEFVFVRDDDLNGLIEQFWRGELKVEPRRYFEALRSIKARLYD
jgi:hypothetical protein